MEIETEIEIEFRNCEFFIWNLVLRQAQDNIFAIWNFRIVTFEEILYDALFNYPLLDFSTFFL